jgi:hypothetical protein
MEFWSLQVWGTWQARSPAVGDSLKYATALLTGDMRAGCAQYQTSSRMQLAMGGTSANTRCVHSGTKYAMVGR